MSEVFDVLRIASIAGSIWLVTLLARLTLIRMSKRQVGPRFEAHWAVTVSFAGFLLLNVYRRTVALGTGNVDVITLISVSLISLGIYGMASHYSMWPWNPWSQHGRTPPPKDNRHVTDRTESGAGAGADQGPDQQ